MARNESRGRSHKERQVSVRGVRRDPPDLRKLARALAALAIAQVEAEAQADNEARLSEAVHEDTESDEKAAS